MLKSWILAKPWYRIQGLQLEGSPEDEVWYFAFGANMHDSAFRDRRGMRPLEWRPARIRGYRLRFNLEGRPIGKAAPANISPDPEAEVWGVLYRITRRAAVKLDASEGVPGRRYRPLWLEALDIDGNRMMPSLPRASPRTVAPRYAISPCSATAHAPTTCPTIGCAFWKVCHTPNEGDMRK